MVTAQQKTDPILVRLWPLEETRTPNKGCVYVAACEMGGVPYSARSRSGSATELARVLVAAGVPDAAMVVTHRGLKGQMTYRAFHEAARWTYEETATKPLHRVRWVDPADKVARIVAACGPKRGVKVPAGSSVAPEPLAAE